MDSLLDSDPNGLSKSPDVWDNWSDSDPNDSKVLERLDTIAHTQVQLVGAVNQAQKKLTAMKRRIHELEVEVTDVQSKSDCFRCFGMVTLPVVFAYMLEAMLTPDAIANSSLQALEPRHLVMIFRSLCLVFAMCVGLPLLLEEIFSYNNSLSSDPTPPRAQSVEESDHSEENDDVEELLATDGEKEE